MTVRRDCVTVTTLEHFDVTVKVGGEDVVVRAARETTDDCQSYVHIHTPHLADEVSDAVRSMVLDYERLKLSEQPQTLPIKAVESLVIGEDVKGLLISVPGNISDEGIHRLQQNWEEAFAGTRAGKTPTVVLCDGVSVSTVVEPVGTYDLRHMGEQDTTPCMMCGGAGEHSDQTGEGTVMCGSCSGEGEVPVDDGECGGWCESSQ